LQEWGDLNVHRHYANAGVVDESHGSTSNPTTGGSVRLDWVNAFTPARVQISPYTKLTLSRSKVDAFSENGGAYPATYSSRTETTTEQTLGVNLTRPLTKKLTALATVEGTHRFQKWGAPLDGSVPGLSNFTVAGERFRQDWLRVTVGFETPVGPGTFTAAVNATTPGEQTTVWFSTGYQIHF